MKIYSENVLNKIYEIEKNNKYPIQIKCNRYSDCDVVFVPEALLLTYLYQRKIYDIPYNMNDFFEIHYECNTTEPSYFDFGILSNIHISTTHKDTKYTEDQKLKIFEAYYDFLCDESQREFEIDTYRDLVKDTQISHQIHSETI